MKIYRVIFKSIDIDEADNTLIITTFQNRELAEQYLKERIEELKEQEEILKQDDYVTEDWRRWNLWWNNAKRKSRKIRKGK